MKLRFFRSKQQKAEAKQKRAEKRLKEFTDRYSEYFNSYCYIQRQNRIVIFFTPEVLKGEVIINFIVDNTPEGKWNYKKLDDFTRFYGEDFLKKFREDYVSIREQAKKLGLEFVFIKKEKT